MSEVQTVPDTPTLPQLAVALDADSIDRLASSIALRVSELIHDPAQDGWMTSEEASEYLALPVRTIWKLTAAEAIPFSQDAPGGRCYFLRSQLDRWRLESAQGPWN